MNGNGVMKRRVVRKFNKTVVPLFEDGTLKAVVHEVIEINMEDKEDEEKVNEAHRIVEDNENVGKVVIMNTN